MHKTTHRAADLLHCGRSLSMPLSATVWRHPLHPPFRFKFCSASSKTPFHGAQEPLDGELKSPSPQPAGGEQWRTSPSDTLPQIRGVDAAHPLARVIPCRTAGCDSVLSPVNRPPPHERPPPRVPAATLSSSRPLDPRVPRALRAVRPTTPIGLGRSCCQSILIRRPAFPRQPPATGRKAPAHQIAALIDRPKKAAYR